jgi:hypothetical protein
MHRTRGWTGLRTAAIALGIGALIVPGAQAAPMSQASPLMQYSTTGSISGDGITGQNIISFKAAQGSFTAPSSFSLGEFTVDPLNSGQTTTYNNTPFSITYLAENVDGNKPVPNDTPITLTGVLNGTFSGPDQSSVVATFNPVDLKPFQTGAFVNTLSILGNSVSLVPSTTNGGQTTVQASMAVTASPSPSPVPEPASLAIFLTAAAALGFRRRLLRARAA